MHARCRPRRSTPLTRQRARRHLHVLRWMAEQGVNICTTDPVNGFNVLHAACKGDEPELLRELLEWDLPVPTPDGLAPLHSSEHDPAGDGARCKCAAPSRVCCDCTLAAGQCARLSRLNTVRRRCTRAPEWGVHKGTWGHGAAGGRTLRRGAT